MRSSVAPESTTLQHQRLAWAWSIVGLCAGLLLCEVIARSFTSPLDAQPSKYYKEGISVFTRDADQRRHTGSDWLQGAASGLILGDSHVDAQQVNDDETMGSVIERAARASGVPLNIVQYGWGAEGLAAYLGFGPELRDKWRPTWTAIVVNEGDFNDNALGGVAWTMSIDPAGQIELDDNREPPPTSGPRYWLRGIFQRSALLTAAYPRLKEIRPTWGSGNHGEPDLATPSEQTVQVPRPALRQLKVVFGERLLLLYLPIVGLTPLAHDEAKEAQLMAACAEEGLRCISVRPEMVRLRDAHDIARGFENTLPGTGHLNALGHRVAGEAIWNHVKAAGWSGLR